MCAVCEYACTYICVFVWWWMCVICVCGFCVIHACTCMVVTIYDFFCICAHICEYMVSALEYPCTVCECVEAHIHVWVVSVWMHRIVYVYI